MPQSRTQVQAGARPDCARSIGSRILEGERRAERAVEPLVGACYGRPRFRWKIFVGYYLFRVVEDLFGAAFISAFVAVFGNCLWVELCACGLAANLTVFAREERSARCRCRWCAGCLKRCVAAARSLVKLRRGGAWSDPIQAARSAQRPAGSCVQRLVICSVWGPVHVTGPSLLAPLIGCPLRVTGAIRG